MRYRITLRKTEEIIIEGEGEIPYAEARQEDLASGVINEEADEVSSFRIYKQAPVLELLLDEENEVWGTLS